MTDSNKSDHDLLIEMHAALMGTNGQGGLGRQVEKNTRSLFRLWIAVTVLAVSAGGGAYGLIELISKVSGG
jgi:hypothetical protein